MVYYIAGYALKVFLTIFGGPIKVFGREKLPKNDGYVIACTHTGWIDILWLGISILPLKINYMAKKELFESKGLKWLMEHLNAFPVDRENPGPSSIKTPMRLIKDGKIVGIFPSGTRSSEDVPLKRGAVTIASYAKSPIIPAAYVGPNNFKELFRFKRAKIAFGEPIHLRKDVPKKEALDYLMEDLNKAMKELQEGLE
ncbi:MAG TPA: 1-acyl-sn-glycerol-3-phosphate acyltransferase [Candidatus Pseudogracilibacillus intestinigallinarum]|uniref:1-acyl-sn-glycerol-3-phosphate acyltransferase n=1 Tax=Candidatus Pseudogracilibacillus intestinigallinarum TaxID=2838742 RepID=A0A9D1PP11_9BACI|nr:1-acyl-sn-glycerol-3-phosphate acyltransferase [Candidatus Pseudogracilibacillus intestinigallinarum]